MHLKKNRFMADWRDCAGRRRRKAFVLPGLAQQFEAKMRQEARAMRVAYSHAAGPAREYMKRFAELQADCGEALAQDKAARAALALQRQAQRAEMLAEAMKRE